MVGKDGATMLMKRHTRDESTIGQFFESSDR